MGISKWRRAALVLPAVTISLLIGACSGTGSDQNTTSAPDGSPIATASVAPIADIVENIAGSYATVKALIPPGVDSHTFEPSPRTTRILAGADVAFFNGLGLEEPTIAMARKNVRQDALVVLLGDDTITPDAYAYDFSFPRAEGKPNPHVWMNPILARHYARLVADTLAERFPGSAAGFRENFDKFARQIAVLDDAIFQAVATIPPDQRKLLTYHDSFAYFAPRYGITVIGAAELSNFQEPSAREVADLIEDVRDSKVRAIFGSEVFPSRVLEQVARETGAEYVDKLRDDELPGEPGDPRHSYIGMMIENVETMTRALGGDPSALSAVPTESNRP